MLVVRPRHLCGMSESAHHGEESAGAKDAALDRIPHLLCSRVKMIIIACDRTLFRLNIFSERIMAKHVSLRDWRRDFADPDFFEWLVKEAAAARIPLRLVSTGFYEPIKAYVDLLIQFPSLRFDREAISTPSCVGSKDGWAVDGGFNRQIVKLCDDAGVDFEDALLFDGEAFGVSRPANAVLSNTCAMMSLWPRVVPLTEDEKNIAYARLLGVQYPVRTPEGFTKDAWAAMLRDFHFL